MRFVVVFQKNTCDDVINQAVATKGIKFVDRVRKTLKTPDLHLENIYSNFPSIRFERIFIDLTEDEAKQISLFQDFAVRHITVFVSLEQFLFREIKVTLDTHGKILDVSPQYKLDKEKLLEAWIQDKCPLQWALEHQGIPKELHVVYNTI